MDAFAASDFVAFFRAVWGFDPFPWQRDLVQRLATGKDPTRNYEGVPGLWSAGSLKAS
jgi:hypothetical protein